MSLRCLLFSSNEDLVQPIWQVLAGLGIEGEYCRSAVDAVERVTTHLFQIVITDWSDQPEAGFLLKTARDLKAAQRPLTLAIVGEESKLPEALQAGANSVLLKPIRPEQVRDTMSTACQLLQAKQQAASAPPAPAANPSQLQAVPQTPAQPAAMAAAATVSTPSATVASAGVPPASAPAAPASVRQAPERVFRAGEFLQSPNSGPGRQFDTESDVQDHHPVAEADALTELEPIASAVQDSPGVSGKEPAEAPEESKPLTGWAALQARLSKSAPPAAQAAPENDLLSYADTPSHGSAERPAKEIAAKAPKPESESEDAHFDYMTGEEQAPRPRSKIGLIFLAAVVAVFAILVAVPRTRQRMGFLSHSGVRAAKTWMNPPPAPLPPTVTQHDSFGQSGDEYKLPTPANIPDATTDPSQIQVLPVIDPTAKQPKPADENATQPQVGSGSNPSDQNSIAGGPNAGTPVAAAPAVTNQPSSMPANAVPAPTTAASAAAPQTEQTTPPASTQASAQANSAAQQFHAAPPATQTAPAQTIPAPSVPVQHTVSPPASTTSIPSSLKSQIAANTVPDASGAMPVEAAMSSIEPVKLPESVIRGLLAQSVDPVYPDTAKASGQRGSVTLEVFIGRDGAVQDAKFLQGSLAFARTAIDAVKQWRFKPYSMNGRTVSVQSVITLNFKPPA
jgi:periplasmic protein TonB